MRSRSVRRTIVRRAAAFIVFALTVPLAGCAAPGRDDGSMAIDLARAGCPAEIRVQTDDRPGLEWGFLYSLLDPGNVDILNAGTVARSPLTVDGESTGVTLTILTGNPFDGVSADIDLYNHEDLLLAAVDTDRAILDAVRYPTVGLFSPTLRDSRMFFWDTDVYPGVRSLEGLGDTLDPTGENLLPVVAAPHDPFIDFMVGEGLFGPEQVQPEYRGGIQQFIDAGGVLAQQGDVLIDPYLLELPDSGFADSYDSQLVDDAGYLRNTLLSARPQTVVRYADCFRVLIPLLQQALADFADDPDATTELLVDLAPKLGYPEFDAGLAAYGLATMKKERIVGSGRDDAFGVIDMGHLRELLDDVVPAWEELDISVPSDLDPGDIATNRFIDRSIGF